MKSSDILERLSQTLNDRKTADPRTSYVASLYAKGIDKILEKIGEEAIETILAGKNSDKDQLIYETADLWFHTLIALSYYDIQPQAILDELARREGLSGITEKAQRAEKS